MIHPSRPAEDTPDSERKVFDTFREQLPDDWVVIHSKRFMIPALPGRRSNEGEVDFIVFDPKRGFVGLEVKGGGISQGTHGWASRDRHGNVHSIKEPGKQAQNAVNTIARYLRETPWFKSNPIIPRYGWGVVFPDIEVSGVMGPELPRDVIIDREDLRDAKSAVDAVFVANGMNHAPVTAKVQTEFMKALVPTLNLMPSLSGRIDDEKAALIQLTDEQMQLLDFMGEARRIGVRGVAGSGKTLVGMEMASRLTGEGKRVLFLCYNRFLADFLSGGTDGFVVKHYHRLCSDLASAAGLSFSVPTDAGEQQEFWETAAPEILENALDILPDERWDAVIVDEGQDFRELWWLGVRQLLKDPENGYLWVFYDPNQDIFGGGPIDALDLQPANLTYNCRNTIRIADYSGKLIDVEPRLRLGTPEGLECIEVTCANGRDMVNGVRRILHEVINEGDVEARDVVILSPRGTRTGSIWKANDFGNFRLVEYPTVPQKNEIQFATLQSFKGLEADVVILCDVDPGEPGASPRHLYVGTSRARHLLAVLTMER